MMRRRRLRRWTVRSRPHLERFSATLDVIATASAKTHLVGIGDQLLAAVAELADYLAADPCPRRDLRDAYAQLLDVVSVLAAAFTAWHRMAPSERTEAVELVHGLGEQADRVAAVAGPLP